MKIKIDKNFIKKIGYDKFIIMMLAGVVLFICSFGNSTSESKKTNSTTVDSNVISNTEYSQKEYVSELETRLTDTVSAIKGVGKVKVMITLNSSNELVVQEDISNDSEKNSEYDEGEVSLESNKTSLDKTTIFYIDSQGNEYPYVVKQIMPEIEGIAVIAEGASDAAVKGKIVEMVQALFNIEAHKISVVDMN